MTQDRALLLHRLLAPERPVRVVDVGANPLEPPPYARLVEIDACEVWGFEPQPDPFARLMADRRPGQTYLPHALGDGAPATLHVCRGDGFTSLYRPSDAFVGLTGRWPRKMQVLGTETVETRRLDDIDEIPEFDLLKIDVQGSETTIFQHGQQKLAGALAVVTEVAMVPLYEGQPLLDAQMRELRGLGYDFHKFLFLKSHMVTSRAAARLRPRRLRSQAVDGDAVFIRDLFALDGLPTERLRHLALLAETVFDSPDLVLRLLDLLAARGAVTGDQADAYLAALPETLFR